MNSRPLTGVSDDPNGDSKPLSDGTDGRRFCTGECGHRAIQPPKVLEKSSRLHKTWVQTMDERILTTDRIKTEKVLP